MASADQLLVSVGSGTGIPLMDRARFAELVGVSLATVNAQVARGLLPVVKIGKRSYINLVALERQCAVKL
ncbi:helix-turn-helix domain-containing protein [Burkholderia cepacia]|uniref:helix-turn-helix domain-containing protein n=1 Tax=Burkholderia cepacia TaxID=292 RepID=UPI00264B04BB|nr:helix-turn-helix domain-containing protein [Burkholderia cepacia]MDN7616602.1 helix-turn-helix domain-containing protein [Burkholderia cepacia]